MRKPKSILGYISGLKALDSVQVDNSLVGFKNQPEEVKNALRVISTQISDCIEDIKK